MMAVDPTQSQPELPTEAIAITLINTTQQLIQELRPHRANAISVSLDSSLERDLGFDSLGRVEVLDRLERALHVRLPEHLLASAETPRDFLRAIANAGAPVVTDSPTLSRTPAVQTPTVQDDSVRVPTEARTLVDMLKWHVQTHPDRLHITLYGDGDTVEEITYRSLYDQALKIAAGLRQRDVQPRQTVALMLPTSRAFFDSFYGILLAGNIPVPIYPPMRPSQIEEHMRRQVGILSNAQTVTLITVREAQSLARLLRPQVPTLRHIVTVDEVATEPIDDALPVLQAEDLALLQYTSGSTGNPKAEGTLGLAFPPFERGPRVDRVQRDAFTRAGRAIPAADDLNALAFVSCGHPIPGHQIRIVDSTGYEVAERQEGQLEFCGPSVTSGYYRNLEDTSRLYHGDWADSGDLAYIAAGEGFITGRAKDIIIRAGRNIYPHELETAVGDIVGIRKGCVAAFGSIDANTGTERLVILAETRESNEGVRADMRRQIDALVVDLLGTTADEVVLAPPQTVLKTSSGKIRRSASREPYEQGDIGTQSTAVWRQVIRLAITGVGPQLRRTWRAALDLAYAGYVIGLFGLLAGMLWIALALIPKREWCQRLTRSLARLMLRLVGMPLHVRGLDHLPTQTPCVVVSNHASYIDAVVLVAALPPKLCYVAKREHAGSFITRLLFQRLGTEFVERFDAQKSIDDTARVLETVKQGSAVVFFPEGTFGREPGLRPFRMGAFMVAAQAQVPIVPLALRGTRSILRSGQWLPRRGAVRLTIEAPIKAEGSGWTAAIKLRDQTHAAILQHCGEPALENPAERSVLTPDPS